MPTPTLLQGTLDVMILATLSREPLHGYGIARTIERTSRGLLKIEEGSLYPALKRLSTRGFVGNAWEISGTGRRARYYSVTRSGRRELELQIALWRTVSDAVTRVIEPASDPGPARTHADGTH